MKYYNINHKNNEMKGYQSSLDGSDDNFHFNDDYNDDAKDFLGCSFSYFVFYYDF